MHSATLPVATDTLGAKLLEDGSCPSCGRDLGYDGVTHCTVADDCPSFWEDRGIPHPDHSDETGAATLTTPQQTATLARLADQKDALTRALVKLDDAGLSDEPPAHQARRYLATVKHSLAGAAKSPFNPHFDGMSGINGFGPGIAATLREADFYLTRFVHVERLSESRIAA